MNMPSRVLALVCLVGPLVACSSAPKISTDYDPQYDFSGLSTYHLVERNVAADPNDESTTLNDQRVTRAIVGQMAQRGLTAVASGDADIVLNFHLVTSDRTQVTSYNDRYGYRGYDHGRGYRRGGSRVDVWEYTEGTLILDLIDPKENRIVWRGEASALVKDRTSEERDAMANSYIASMFASMPPPLGKPE